MPRRPSALLAAVLSFAALPALAQESGEAEERGLTSPDVRESLSIGPTEQGMLPPDQLQEDDDPRLYDLLAQVRRSLPTLDAEHSIPRPNAFASEPAKEMPPEQVEDISLFPEDYVE